MAAVDFYREKLGFSHPQLFGDPPQIAILDRDGFELYLISVGDEATISPSGGWDMHLRVSDLQAELQALRQLKVPIEFGPTEMINGIRKREFFEVLDPNGYCVCIEQQTWLTGSNRRNS